MRREAARRTIKEHDAERRVAREARRRLDAIRQPNVRGVREVAVAASDLAEERGAEWAVARDVVIQPQAVV